MAEIIPITDFQAPELDIYARCSESQLLHYYEPNGGIFIAESPKVIERALNMGCEPISLLAETKHPDTRLAGIISRCPDIPVYTAPYEILTKLTGFALTRGALCAMRRPALRSVEELCRNARRIAILEDVVNPTNVGAIIRSAAALRMDAVLLTPACSDPFYRRAARVSMGTVFSDSVDLSAIRSILCHGARQRIRRIIYKTASGAWFYHSCHGTQGSVSVHYGSHACKCFEACHRPRNRGGRPFAGDN